MNVEIRDNDLEYFKEVYALSDRELLLDKKTLAFLKHVGSEYSRQELDPIFKEVANLFWNAYENSKSEGTKFSCLSCEGFLQPKDFRVDDEWIYYFLECHCCGNKEFIKLERIK